LFPLATPAEISCWGLRADEKNMRKKAECEGSAVMLLLGGNYRSRMVASYRLFAHLNNLLMHILLNLEAQFAETWSGNCKHKLTDALNAY
jgi:hypothetical protein